MGIIICGLNGTGKSTLGKVLAEKLHFHFIDIETLYFPMTDSDNLYTSPRTREEVEKLLLHEMKTLFLLLLKVIMGKLFIPFFSMPYCLMLQKTFGCNGLKIALFRSSVIECY